MKVAYFILAHHQPELLNELITAINKPKEQVFVHIDKKIEIQPFLELLKDKCIFTEQREKVYWGSFTIIKAYRHLLKTAMNRGRFDYYSLHSGVDFPIKPIEEFEVFLEKNKGSEFIITKMCTPDHKFAKRYSGYFVFENYSKFFLKLNFGITKLQRIFYKRKTYKGENVYFGSQWWTLTYECLQYVISRLEKEPALSRYFKHTLIPDEVLYQTIIGNSPFAEKVTHNNLRCIVFENNNPNPKVLRIEDKENLLASPAFFARKFDVTQDVAIIDFLKQHIK